MVTTRGTYTDFVGKDPNTFLRGARARGRIVWDDGIKSWLITDMADVSYALRHEDEFTIPFPGYGFSDFFGRRALLVLEGDAHRQLYLAVRRCFTPEMAQRYRESFILPIIEGRLARILSAGSAELTGDYAEQIPVRVIAGILGLDWRDDALIGNCWDWIDAYQVHLLNYILPGDAPEQTRAAAVAGMRKMNDALMPLVRAKGDLPEDSYVREVDRAGRDYFPDWSDSDTVDQCKFLFVAGMHTSTALMCNAIHFLLTDPKLMAEVAADPDAQLAALVEETLRLRPSIQLRPRIATKDMHWHGADIEKGDQVLAILASANRSPERFENPDVLDTSRDQLGRHLSFNSGERFCGGAPLARVEAVESLRAVVTRMPGLQLDYTRPEPHYSGFIQRTMRPLHVLFDAQRAEDASNSTRTTGTEREGHVG